ncbi:MAG TPA: hypothetical protein DC054_11100 [Blastocatellia bacterium]|nr:hypothetical protein [Blastocatellia bacterium]
MLEQFEECGWLKQKHCAYQIMSEFGEEWVYINKNRNYGIVKEVLDEFQKITPDDVVWSRGRQLWRRREEWDAPDSRMVR